MILKLFLLAKAKKKDGWMGMLDALYKGNCNYSVWYDEERGWHCQKKIVESR